MFDKELSNSSIFSLKAKVEIEELKDYAKELDGLDDFQPWDQSYYFTKLQKKKFDIDPEMLRPYFKAENVISGIFKVANKLFGKMRQMVKGDAGDLDNKDREPEEPVKDK